MTSDQEARQAALLANTARTPAEEEEFNALNAYDESLEGLATTQAALATAQAALPVVVDDPLKVEKDAVAAAQVVVDSALARVTAAQAPVAPVVPPVV